MGQALYRKYRSKSLSEIVGQEHITDTLGKALKSGRVSHAYLFTGPRGVGKTSIARILAHEINGLPYDENQTHIDIIEIDAASNNGVEDVRDLREKVYVAPALAKYKVYIIDEVHMLSKQAFNALLKTLEEPPAHVVFILATTETHKLPETIISRTQRFIFRPIEPAKAVAHLRTIATSEKIDVSDEALELIAQHGDGSFRDSISLLDQVASHGKHIDLATVQASLGIPPLAAIEALQTAIAGSATGGELLSQLNALYEQGFQAAAIAKQLARFMREQLLAGKTSLEHGATFRLLAQLLDVPISHDPERFLEIILLSQASTQTSTTVAPKTVTPDPVASPKAVHKTATPEVVAEPLAAKLEAPAEPKVEQSKKKLVHPSDAVVLDEANWGQVLGKLKTQHNTLYGIIRMAQADFSTPGVLGLSFAFAFHQKRVNEPKNQQALSDAIVAVTGGTVEIRCVHDASLKDGGKPAKAESPLPDVPASTTMATAAPIAAISNIFGGAEVLE